MSKRLVTKVRYDLVLKGENTIVEVKYWTADFVWGNNNAGLSSLIGQLSSYQAQGKQLVLEMFQTQTNALTQADWQRILYELQAAGINLSSQSQLLPPMQ